MDPQAYINLLLKHFTAEEVAAFLTFTDEYPFQEDKPGYLQYSTLGLQPQLQRMYVSAAAGIDNVVVPFAEYILEPLQLVTVHVAENTHLSYCEHALVADLFLTISQDASVLFDGPEITITDIVIEDIPDIILALISYHHCKHTHH